MYLYYIYTYILGPERGSYTVDLGHGSLGYRILDFALPRSWTLHILGVRRPKPRKPYTLPGTLLPHSFMGYIYIYIYIFLYLPIQGSYY